MINLRKLHLLIGVFLSPFLFAQAVTGFVQALGKFPRLVVGIHSWALITRYLAFAVAAGLAFMAATGAVLYLNTYIQKQKRKAAAQVKQ